MGIKKLPQECWGSLPFVGLVWKDLGLQRCIKLVAKKINSCQTIGFCSENISLLMCYR
jgi:hypothetical protein